MCPPELNSLAALFLAPSELSAGHKPVEPTRVGRRQGWQAPLMAGQMAVATPNLDQTEALFQQVQSATTPIRLRRFEEGNSAASPQGWASAERAEPLQSVG